MVPYLSLNAHTKKITVLLKLQEHRSFQQFLAVKVTVLQRTLCTVGTCGKTRRRQGFGQEATQLSVSL